MKPIVWNLDLFIIFKNKNIIFILKFIIFLEKSNILIIKFLKSYFHFLSHFFYEKKSQKRRTKGKLQNGVLNENWKASSHGWRLAIDGRCVSCQQRLTGYNTNNTHLVVAISILRKCEVISSFFFFKKKNYILSNLIR